MHTLSTEQMNDLKSAATGALKVPYPKNAQTVYGAAVLSTEGNVYAAAQYFSDTYSLTLHAEQCALVHAAAHGEGDIQGIAVTSTVQGELEYCCHMCKQVLWENHLRTGIDFPIIFFNQAGKEEVVTITELINYPWPRKQN